MMTEKEQIHSLLNEIHEMIEKNETEEGTFRFDAVRIMVALDFVKKEIEKSVATYLSQMD